MLSNPHFKVPGAMGVAAFVALLGFALTFVLPEPNQKSLEDIEREGRALDEKLEEAFDESDQKSMSSSHI